MKKADLENRIRELEFELTLLKSGGNTTSTITNCIPEEQNFKFPNVADFIPAHIAYVNAETLQYEFVNELYVKSFGIPRDKIIGNHVKNVIGEKNYQYALKYIEAVKAGRSESYENLFDLVSGKRWLHVDYSPVFDDNSKVVGIALISYDITYRKQIEKALVESEGRFQLLFNKAPLGYQSLDIDGNFIDVNQQWLDTLGYTREEVIGKWFGDFLSPEYQDGFRKRFPIFKAQGKIHSEFEMVHKDSSKLFIAFEGSIGYDNFGEFKQTHCILQDISENKRSQEKLKKSEERLKMVLDATPFPVALVDTQDNIIQYWSQSAVTLFGHTAPTADEWYMLAYPDENYRQEVIERWKPFLEIARETSQPVNTGEYMVTCSNGSVLCCELYATFIEDSLIVTFNNINKRKRAEEEFRSLAESMPQIVWTTNADGSYTYFNQRWMAYTGLTLEESLGQGWIKPFHPEDKQMAWDVWQNAVTNKADYSIECRLRCYDGKFHWWLMRGVPQLGLKGEITKWFGTCTDIEMIKNAEAEIKNRMVEIESINKKLRKSEYELKRAQEITHIGSFTIDLKTNEVSWSDELYKMYGFNPSLTPPLLNESNTLFTPESWELLSLSIANTVETGIPYEIELRTVRADGSNGWMWARGEVNRDSNGTVTTLWGAVQDISVSKEREVELEKALERASESDRLKTAFLTNMSHEIRTPMNGILGFAELLKEPRLSSDDQRNYISTIEKSGERLLNTINSIINISKIEAGQVNLNLSATNINEKIEFCYQFFKPEVEAKGLQFYFRNGLSSNNSIIKSDNEKVYGILTNLLKNAIKFTDKGNIEFGYDRKGDFLEFFVRDTGRGINAQQLEYIFDRFRQGSENLNRNYEGSGLGLTIAKSYVEMLGGRIYVESHEGKGSTFYFTIPYVPASKDETEIKIDTNSNHAEVNLKNLKILIVEDDEISHSMLTRAVKKISQEILHAITGQEAVETCRNNPDIDLVLMDIRMPVMNGLEATHQIRQFNQGVIIIAQTAYGFESDSKRALEAGCNDYLSKPLNLNHLVDLIKKYLQKD